MWITRVFLFVVVTILFVNAKIYDSRCKLVRDLIKSGMPRDIFLGQWVCLIEQVSKRDTAMQMIDSNGKYKYGLYQIPSKWCRTGKKGGDCNIKCESLLDDDITDDTACAQNIFQKEGFKYWSLWERRCKKNVDALTREIYKCPGMTSSRTGLDGEFMRYRRMLATRYSTPILRV